MEWNLSRKSAAKLLGRSDRWLNDQNDAPRNPDKTYPAIDLVAWFVDRQTDPDDLKEEKLKEEINVLKERNRKLQFENEVTAGNMADIRSLQEMLSGLVVPVRKLGEMLGRKASISGPDAQQMLNQTIVNYKRLLCEQFGANEDDNENSL